MSDGVKRIGIILLVIGACLYGYFVHYANYKLKASGGKYVDKTVAAIFSSWSKEELTRYAAPELMKYTPMEQWDTFLATYSRIGNLTKYKGCTYNDRLTRKTDVSDEVTLVYVAEAEFENGFAQLNIKIIQKDDDWAIFGLQVISPFYDAIAKDISMENKCKNNLRMIDQVKDQAALTANCKMGDPLSAQDISPFLPQGFSGLVCPKGGHYTINVVGTDAECSEHGSMKAFKPKTEAEKTTAARTAAMQPEAEREGLREESRAGDQLAPDSGQHHSDKQIEEDELKTSATKYTLNGIMGGKGNYRALINNTVFIIGDPVGSGRVRSMDSTKVTIESSDGTTMELLIGASTMIP